MTKKRAGPAPPKGVKKPGGKAALQSQSGPPENAASFLKQRLGKKVRELRLGGSAAAATANVAGLVDLQAEALRRGGEFERDTQGSAVDEEEENWGTNPSREAENTRKRFYGELRKVIAAADVVIEVLDARDPAACRSEDVEREVTAAGKRLVLLLNKIDLVPKTAVEAWLKHLQRSFPAIAFKAAHGGAHRPTHAMTSVARAPEGLLRSTHAVVGADEVMQLLKNYARTGGTKSKAHLSVGIVGYPNTGKSSVINSMKRHSAVETGGRAGVTKVMQEVQLDGKITLIDSPGVVFEGSSDDPSVVLRNVVRVENVTDPVSVVDALVTKAPREAVLKYYAMNHDFAQVSDFLIHVARARGKLRRGSGLDLASAAKSVISDWTTGKFRYYVLPPSASQADAAKAEEETAEVVSALAPALDVDALLGGGGDLPSVLGAPAVAQQEAGGDDVAMQGGENETVEVDMAAMER